MGKYQIRLSVALPGEKQCDEMNVISFVYNEGVMASLSSAISTNTSMLCRSLAIKENYT